MKLVRFLLISSSSFKNPSFLEARRRIFWFTELISFSFKRIFSEQVSICVLKLFNSESFSWIFSSFWFFSKNSLSSPLIFCSALSFKTSFSYSDFWESSFSKEFSLRSFASRRFFERFAIFPSRTRTLSQSGVFFFWISSFCERIFWKSAIVPSFAEIFFSVCTIFSERLSMSLKIFWFRLRSDFKSW